MQIANMVEAEAIMRQFYGTAPKKRQKYNLSRMIDFMHHIGDPQNQIKVIHVAGTSGKTSTCYFICAQLCQAGLKVGLTVSPHINSVAERLQIGGKPVSDSEFAAALGEFVDIVRASGFELTYFELMMALAYWYFAKQKIDVAVIETGLGGLLDASNVVTSHDKFCVITDIGLDHTEILGNTIEKIAAQKAGIIGFGNKVFMYRQSPAINKVFSERSEICSAELYFADQTSSTNFDDLPLFQRRNWALALAVTNAWLAENGRKPLTKTKLNIAHKVVVPGRMEVIKVGNKTIVLDGAHNSQKMHSFVESFAAQFGHQKAAVLLAVKEGKEYESVLDMVLPIARRVVLTSFSALQDTPIKSVKTKELAKACKRRHFKNYVAVDDYHEAYKELLEFESTVLVVTGSLYLVAAVRQLVRAK